MVRTPRANKQSFKYSLYLDKTIEYKKDKNGNIETVLVNGKEIPIEKEIPPHYSKPIDFEASMQMSSRDAKDMPFGIDTSLYGAILTTPKGMLPITETSLIWSVTEPKYGKDGFVNPDSADYKVAKIVSSLQYDRYVLEKKVNN